MGYTATLTKGKTYTVNGMIFKLNIPRSVPDDLAKYLGSKDCFILGQDFNDIDHQAIDLDSDPLAELKTVEEPTISVDIESNQGSIELNNLTETITESIEPITEPRRKRYKSAKQKGGAVEVTDLTDYKEL